MSDFLSTIAAGLMSTLNLSIPRTVNGKAVSVPVLGGVKVGVSGEKWMSGVLTEIFRYADGGIFYDVGINLGQTLIKVKTLAPDMKYVGFEPNPSCVAYLDALVSSNRWKNIKVVPAGLSDSDGVVPLYGSDGTDPESTIVAELRSEGQKTVKFVPVFRHESIEGVVLDGRVSVLKIDVEGAELEVVRSLQGLIERDRPVIIMEVLPNRQENELKARRSKEMVGMISGFGYSFYRIMKTEADTYRGIAPVSDVGDYTDSVMKDHVFVPTEQVDAIGKVLTVLAG
ncbi:FkbM family methyltransferase [Pelodictyon luteolum]|uniref:Methyltransferase FkbM n=1 Tax=Chlorobium luteolum (strain DSM 273 / BCRC 81028 / 2530) TaxID=319225 RepID=Q3B1Y4_CHLL3|nr:FkbM family methyltransferase [Pelodictyon luteolum]ABB24647.1 Methyltransferase FkbM [Pelodictyon luteolum DSM 273]